MSMSFQGQRSRSKVKVKSLNFLNFAIKSVLFFNTILILLHISSMSSYSRHPSINQCDISWILRSKVKVKSSNFHNFGQKIGIISSAVLLNFNTLHRACPITESHYTCTMN